MSVEAKPKGWVAVPLGTIVQTERAFAEGNEQLRDYVGLEQIEAQTGRILGFDTSAKSSANAFAFDTRHVLYAKLRPYLNKVAMPDFAGRCSTEAIPLLPSENLDRRYLAAFLRRPDTINSVMAEKTGSRMPRADMKALMRLPIPLPPVAEQRRIANRLDAAMADIAAARAALTRQREEVDTLVDQCACRLFNAEAVEAGWSTLGQASPVIEYGHTASARSGDGPRFLRITDIKPDGVSWPSVPTCAISTAELHQKALTDGDIVVARTGGTVGKSFLVIDPPEAVFASYLVRIRARGDHSSQYIYRFLQTSLYWNALRGFARGGAQPNVNASLLKQIPIPLPDLARQHAVVRDLAKIEQDADSIIAALDRQAAALDALGPALLNAAFRGEF